MSADVPSVQYSNERHLTKNSLAKVGGLRQNCPTANKLAFTKVPIQYNMYLTDIFSNLMEKTEELIYVIVMSYFPP